MIAAEVQNHPELGFITVGCPVCEALRAKVAALTAQNEAALPTADMESDDMQGVVHPNEFLAAFAERCAHEKATGHTTFGWRFINEARKQAAAFAAEASPTSLFWSAFSARFLTPPSTTPA